MGFRNCIFFDSDNQFVSKKELEDSAFAHIPHGQWYVQILHKELNQFIAAHTTQKIVSPLTFLYLMYKKDPQPNALYLLILDEYLYMTTFEDETPLFTKIYALDRVEDLASTIESYLHDFYAQPGSFFVEKIIIYNLKEDFILLPHELEERLLLDIDVRKEGLDFLCDNSQISQYFLNLPNNGKKLRLSNRFIVMVGLGILLLLAIGDIYLRYSSAQYSKKIGSLVLAQAKVANFNNDTQSKLLHLQNMAPLIRTIKERNIYAITRIRDLFDQIPSHTYLNSAEFSKEGAVLQGASKQKEEIYALDRKLAKTFKTHRLILQKEDGWYKFRGIYKEMSDETD